MISDLELDSTATRVADGVHALDLSDRWGIGGGALNGGYQLVVALRALGAEMRLPDPVVASASFLRPAVAGPARVLTEVVREGRRLGTGTARLVQPGRDGAERDVLRVEATFTDLSSSPADARDFVPAPTLPTWEECVELEPDHGADDTDATVSARVRVAAPSVPGWARGAPTDDPRAEFWMRFADGSDPTLPSLAFVVDGAAPVVFELGRASSTVQLTVHFREHPGPGALACRTVTRHLAHGVHEEDVEVFDAAGVLVAQSRQLALLS